MDSIDDDSVEVKRVNTPENATFIPTGVENENAGLEDDQNNDMDYENAQKEVAQHDYLNDEGLDHEIDIEEVNQVLDWSQHLQDEQQVDTTYQGVQDEARTTPKTPKSPSRRTPGGTRLPVISPGTAQLGRIPSPTQSDKMIGNQYRYATMGISRQSPRKSYPPKVRLATVAVSARAREAKGVHGPSMYYEEPLAQGRRKVISWNEATNARPPLRIDMEGPTPWTYSPRNKPLYETNSPSFTFGSKCWPEKDKEYGSRTAWGKTWFQSSHAWTNKADFYSDRRWPSPAHYRNRPLLGPRQATMPEAPSYTIQTRPEFSICRYRAEDEPAPSAYNIELADKVTMKTAPSLTHRWRLNGTAVWGASEKTPGPGTYSPKTEPVKRHNPSFTFRGIRGTRSYALGPFSAF